MPSPDLGPAIASLPLGRRARQALLRLPGTALPGNGRGPAANTPDPRYLDPAAASPLAPTQMSGPIEAFPPLNGRLQPLAISVGLQVARSSASTDLALPRTSTSSPLRRQPLVVLSAKAPFVPLNLIPFPARPHVFRLAPRVVLPLITAPLKARKTLMPLPRPVAGSMTEEVPQALPTPAASLVAI